MTQQNLAVINDSEWQVMQAQAAALVASGFLPQLVNTPQKVVAIMMLGRELGIPPWAALSTINVIQGKPTVSPQLMLALINRSGQLEDMQVQDEGGTVHVMMKRRGRSEHWASFGQADAIAMNLWSKPNWKSQPATMMKWRAVAACARVVFADVILGLYTHEEMGAEVVVDSDGNQTVVEPAQASTPVLVERVGDTPSAPPTPAPVRENALPASAAPNDLSASTPTGAPNGDASGDEPLFDDRPYTDFLCHELVYTVTNGGSQYTFKSEHGANIVVFGSEWVLGVADYADRDVFKNMPGKVQPLKPPLVVTARFDSKAKRWDVESIRVLEAEGVGK